MQLGIYNGKDLRIAVTTTEMNSVYIAVCECTSLHRITGQKIIQYM